MVYNGVFYYDIGFVLNAANSSSTTAWSPFSHRRRLTFNTLGFATLPQRGRLSRFRYATRPGSPKRVGRVLGWLNKGAKTIPQLRIRSAAPFTQGSLCRSLYGDYFTLQKRWFLPFYAYCSSIIFLYFLYEIALKAMPTTRIAHQDAMVRDQPIISEMRAMP